MGVREPSIVCEGGRASTVGLGSVAVRRAVPVGCSSGRIQLRRECGAQHGRGNEAACARIGHIGEETSSPATRSRRALLPFLLRSKACFRSFTRPHETYSVSQHGSYARREHVTRRASSRGSSADLRRLHKIKFIFAADRRHTRTRPRAQLEHLLGTCRRARRRENQPDVARL